MQDKPGLFYEPNHAVLRFPELCDLHCSCCRALAEIYKSLEQRENEDITLHISYLEIYQEVAYDLLSTSARTASPVTVFPRVSWFVERVHN